MTNAERQRMSEPMVLPAGPPPEDGYWSLPVYWPRFQVSYLNAVGAIRVLSEQLDPRIKIRFDFQSMTFRFSVEPEVAEGHLTTWYKPSPIYSPWNSRAFGTGFNKSLEAARKIPQLEDYVALVGASRDALGEASPKKEGAKRKQSPKELLLIDMVSGKVSLSPAHTRWVRACWRLGLPKTKRGRDEVAPRRLLGSGGCEASCDYGSLFLRAAVAHFKGKQAPGDWTLGGFAFPDTGHWWTPLDVLLLLEGALAFGHPTDGTSPDPWRENGPDRGTLWLPLWEGEKTWEELRPLIASGWVGRPYVTPEGVSHLMPIRCLTDGQLLRMVCSTELKKAWHRQKVELTLTHSPEELGWFAVVQVKRPAHVLDAAPAFKLPRAAEDYVTELGDREEVRRDALKYIHETWGELADITETENDVE